MIQLASVENTVNRLADELISVKIRKEFLNKNNRFPSRSEEGQIKKRVYNLIKKRFNSIYDMRNEKLERKIQNLISEVFEQFKF